MSNHPETKGETMSKQEMKARIEEVAKVTNQPAAKIITAMQGELARMGDEKGLTYLCEIKWDYIQA